MVQVLKVKSTSQVNKVAGAIAEMVREGKEVEVHSIGAGALNQAVKALATARGYVASNGLDLYFIPAFTTLEIDGSERTGIKLIVKY
jgi:stage V sporulation protein S